MDRRCGLRGSGPRRSRCSSRPRLLTPATRRFLLVMGERWRTMAISKKHSTSSRAHTPDDPDWRILSVQGTVLDQLGRNDEARQYYASALKIVPGEPSVLSNLGLSYALSKYLPKAEETLRRAYGSAGADTRVRQNLALVVGLQERFAEA